LGPAWSRQSIAFAIPECRVETLEQGGSVLFESLAKMMQFNQIKPVFAVLDLLQMEVIPPQDVRQLMLAQPHFLAYPAQFFKHPPVLVTAF
jgi:hypothetical protein